jgi:hypothetical protein
MLKVLHLLGVERIAPARRPSRRGGGGASSRLLLLLLLLLAALRGVVRSPSLLVLLLLLLLLLLSPSAVAPALRVLPVTAALWWAVRAWVLLLRRPPAHAPHHALHAPVDRASESPDTPTLSSLAMCQKPWRLTYRRPAHAATVLLAEVLSREFCLNHLLRSCHLRRPPCDEQPGRESSRAAREPAS